MHIFHIVSGFVCGYLIYIYFRPRPDPPGYNIDGSLEEIFPEMADCEDCDQYEDESEEITDDDEYFQSLSEDEKRAKLDRDLEEYYKNAGKFTILSWAYIMGHNDALKDKDV